MRLSQTYADFNSEIAVVLPLHTPRCPTPRASAGAKCRPRQRIAGIQILNQPHQHV